MHSNLYVITTYYNPCRYRTRRAHYDRFRAAIDAANIPCLTVEAALGRDSEFELPDQLDVVRVRSDSLLWQKERLLNLAASWLPRDCKYVAWLDADILFTNPNWTRDLQRTLKTFPVAQVWQRCDRLDQDEKSIGDSVESFAQRMTTEQSLLDAGRYDAHGHTGYGWAMRREIFDQVGLYEGAVSGSADHFMAHAIYDHYGFCVDNALKHDHAQIAHLKAWGRRFYACVKGSLGVVPGNIVHLWHGDLSNRRYFSRMHDITARGYDPWTDITAAPGRPLEWAEALSATKPQLQAYFHSYFQSRQEDGHV